MLSDWEQPSKFPSKAQDANASGTVSKSQVESEQVPIVRVFHPTRILSATTTGDLLDGISKSLDSGAEIILINLQNVSFMDSTGLGALILAHKKIKQAGARLVLCSLGGQARMVLERSGTEKVFEIYMSQQEFNQVVLNQLP